jgi:hypothetical protein
MLVGIVISVPGHSVLPAQIIALEKAGCERFHIVRRTDDLKSLRHTLGSTDLLIEADPSQGCREFPLH